MLLKEIPSVDPHDHPPRAQLVSVNPPRPAIRKVLILSGFLLAGIAGVTALRHSRNHAASSRIAPPAVSLRVEIQSLTLRREGRSAQLVIAARFQQSGQTVLRLESPLVVLRPENGTPAYRYLGPFLPEPVLSGPGPALVSLSWWVQTEDLTGEVFLEVSGKAFPVQSKASFDFPALPENQTVGVSFPDWKVIPGPASR